MAGNPCTSTTRTLDGKAITAIHSILKQVTGERWLANMPLTQRAWVSWECDKAALR